MPDEDPPEWFAELAAQIERSSRGDQLASACAVLATSMAALPAASLAVAWTRLGEAALAVEADDPRVAHLIRSIMSAVCLAQVARRGPPALRLLSVRLPAAGGWE